MSIWTSKDGPTSCSSACKKQIRRSPEKCADLARAEIVRSKDFDLARKLVRDPDGSIRRWSRILNEGIADLANEPPSNASGFDAYIHYYVPQGRLLSTYSSESANRDSLSHFAKMH